MLRIAGGISSSSDLFGEYQFMPSNGQFRVLLIRVDRLNSFIHPLVYQAAKQKGEVRVGHELVQLVGGMQCNCGNDIGACSLRGTFVCSKMHYY